MRVTSKDEQIKKSESKLSWSTEEQNSGKINTQNENSYSNKEGKQNLKYISSNDNQVKWVFLFNDP